MSWRYNLPKCPVSPADQDRSPAPASKPLDVCPSCAGSVRWWFNFCSRCGHKLTTATVSRPHDQTGTSEIPSQEREIEAREECARRGLDPDDDAADGATVWMVVDQELRERAPRTFDPVSAPSGSGK